MKTQNKAVAVATVAAVETVAQAAVESRVTLTKNTRAEWEAQGVGLNNYGTWTGQNNILVSACKWLALNYALLCALLDVRKGRMVAYTLTGCKGTHANLCMLFEGVKFTTFNGEEWQGNVFLKDDGTMFTENICEGFAWFEESELRLQVSKVNDVRKIALDSRKDAKSEFKREVVDGALLGALSGRYQGILYRDANGSRLVTRIFGEVKEHENARAVSVVTLAGDAKETAKRWIFDGIAETAAKVASKGKAAAKVKAAKVAKK